MAHIANLGLGNWGTAIARMWLADNHRVKGWNIEQEVYESITMDSVNAKYLPKHPVEGLEARIFEWIRQSDFETVAWSTPKAAKSFKVKEDEVYEAVAALTRKVPDRIQVFYKQGSLHIAAE